ncbi:MAG: PqqD family protein [Anaerolineae bacterium]|nr:PqqD family protein [Anaerolineae bacterium]
MPDSLKACYEKDPSVVYREIGGEAILVPVRRHVADLDSIYTLDEVGSRIWSLLEPSRSLDEVCHQLLTEYDVEQAVLTADLLEFVEQLESFGAVRRVEP